MRCTSEAKATAEGTAEAKRSGSFSVSGSARAALELALLVACATFVN